MIWKALGKDLYIFWKAPELSKKYAAVAPQVPLLDDELTAGPDDEDALVELEDEELSASEVGMLRAAIAGSSDSASGTLRAPELDAALATLTNKCVASLNMYSQITATTLGLT